MSYHVQSINLKQTLQIIKFVFPKEHRRGQYFKYELNFVHSTLLM